MAIELVVGLAVAALLIGGLAGYFLRGRDSKNQEKIATLESELENSQNELSEYRQAVFQQFSDTADKFKTLDESYNALHRQLATSAVALCGDQGTPLLTGVTPDQIADVEAEASGEVDAPQTHADTAEEGESEDVIEDVTAASEEIVVGEALQDDAGIIGAESSDSVETSETRQVGGAAESDTSGEDTSDANTRLDVDAEEIVPTLTESAEATDSAAADSDNTTRKAG